MNRLLKRIQDGHVKRRERDQRRLIEKWGVVRTKGKARYVLRSTLFCGLGATVLHDIGAHVFDTQPPGLLYSLIRYSIIAVLMSLYSWWDMDGRYKAACIDAYRKSLLTANNPPD